MNITLSRVAPWFAAATLATTLAGCFPAAVVGVGAGALMVADRRVTETYLADEAVEMRAASRISEKFGTETHVNVTSYNRMLLLSGEVPTAEAKAELGRIMAAVPNVKSVSNEVLVGPASSLSSRSTDTYTTSKVKARFVDYNKFPANTVKVVTEWGTVFLLGLATQREADDAVDIARTTGGVQKVVRLFEIISEDEARRLDLTSSDSKTPPAK
jgi:osmotically-inducible protein OsmY